MLEAAKTDQERKGKRREFEHLQRLVAIIKRKLAKENALWHVSSMAFECCRNLEFRHHKSRRGHGDKWGFQRCSCLLSKLSNYS